MPPRRSGGHDQARHPPARPRDLAPGPAGGPRTGLDQIEQIQAEIDTLTTRLGELSEAIEHLRISRKTLLSLAEEDPAPVEPDTPPTGFDHPAYQQILTVFGESGGSLRARDLALAMDLPLTPNGIQNVRAKLKRLVGRGILVETEPGLFAQPRP